jgi:hypothetical protein
MGWLKITDLLTGQTLDTRIMAEDNFWNKLTEREERLKEAAAKDDMIGGSPRSVFGRAWVLSRMKDAELDDLFNDLKLEMRKRKKNAKIRNDK